MADDQAATLRRHRLISLAAVETLAIATALAFSRVFLGGATWKLVLAAATSALLASLLERRSLLLATLFAAWALVFAITWLVFPETSWYGLPTGHTLSSLAEALGQVGRQAREQVSPTVPLEPLLVAAITAVCAGAFSIHALAVRAGSPLLALVPSIALIGFADSALDGEGTIPIAVLFLLGAMAILFADGVRRLRQWGTVRPWRGPSGRTRTLVARGAGSAALLTLGAAVALPGVLPGFGSAAIWDLRAPNDESTRIDPLVSIRAQLTQREHQTLFRVATPVATYYRMLALDQFDGETFTTSDLYASQSPLNTTGQRLVFSEAPRGAAEIQQTYSVASDLDFRWIPAAYQPTSIQLKGVSGFRFDVDRSTAVAVAPLQQDQTYTVDSRYMVPKPDQLAAEQFAPPDRYGVNTRLPQDLPPEIADIASELTAGETTAYGEILAIQRHLRGFKYSTAVEPTADADALVEFLTKTRAGFCQQFATAMTVLVRSLGIPARVAVGFTQGRLDDATGDYVVTTKETHSWVEVYFPSFGWLAFEPTPERSNPIAEPYVNPAPDVCVATPGGCSDAGNGQPGTVNEAARPPGFYQRGPDPLAPPRGALQGRGRSQARSAGPGQGNAPGPNLAPWMLGALGVALIVLLLLPPAKAIRRRARLARAPDDRALVLATYDVFSARAGDLGLGRTSGETMDEYRRRLRRSARFSNGDLDRLTLAASRAAYASVSPGPEETRAAGRAARIAIRDLRRERGRLRQLWGMYRPGL